MGLQHAVAQGRSLCLWSGTVLLSPLLSSTALDSLPKPVATPTHLCCVPPHHRPAPVFPQQSPTHISCCCCSHAAAAAPCRGHELPSILLLLLRCRPEPATAELLWPEPLPFGERQTPPR